ncbi:MFS transporter [Alicyclobacillus fastidiosus]|uniref:MFS transporter n=1 Tax=Alicyclobacillus fastidiosus TaxID=392011 RepID=A0ABV5A8T1_9BACL|nr:MFS transporter [Alicyclobacillus fastidiosus]WEH11997.1 MFS transporter [Alicyclobacillus fastidiosus]
MPSAAPSVKIDVKQAFSYAAGNFGLNLFFNAVSTYLLYFYTDDYGITAAAAGSLMFIVQLVNLVANPAMGVIVDQTRGRWGKFRPYLLFGSLPLAVIGVLTFSVPSFDHGGKILYAYITYILFNVIYSFVNVPYSSLLAAMSDDYYARARISSIKVSIGQFGGLVVTTATLPLVHLFHVEATGFKYIYSIFGLLLLISMLISFFGTKGVGHEHSRLQKDGSARGKHSLKTQLKAAVANKYLLLLLLFILVQQLSLSIKNSVAVYFFKYNIGRADLFSLYSLIGFAVMIVFILVNPSLVNRVGKRNTGIIGECVVAVGLLGFFLFHSHVLTVFVFGAIAYAGFGITTPLLWSMVPDTVEYGEWKTGIRAEGNIYASFIFVQLLAQAVSAKLSGSMLSAIGYVANQAQTATALHGILVMETLLPTIGALLCVCILLFYRFNYASFKQVVSDIHRRDQVM